MTLNEKEKGVLKLLKEDATYENYFFKKVKDIKWFIPLKNEGYFNPEKAPAPIQVKDGYQMPFWAPLYYLEVISLEIKAGNYKEYIEDILDIINNISNKQEVRGNYLTWFHFIKILCNLPNESISISTLDNIPIWLSTTFNNDLLSNEICEKLLSKFLNNNSTEVDIKKAETILIHIFKIVPVKNNDDGSKSSYFERGYRTIINPYWLKITLIDKKLVELIANRCSNNVVLALAQSIRKMLLDFPNGLSIRFTIQEIGYRIRVYIIEKDLKIIIEKETDKTIKETEKIKNFESKDEVTLLNELIEKINIEVTINGNEQVKIELTKIANSLNHDLSTIWCNDISKIGDQFIHGSDPKVIFALILRDILNLKAKTNQEQTTVIINLINNSIEYKLPFFKRISIYLISENWDVYSSFFWDMNSTEKNLFSKYDFDKEIYNLLKKNITKFSSEEKEIIKEIISLGPKDKWSNKDDSHKEYWQLKWLSAVKDDNYFISDYTRLFEKLKISREEYENIGVIKTSIGPVSTHSVEALGKMTNSQIVQELLEFTPGDEWIGPSREGLGRALEQAIIRDPASFANELSLYVKVNYLYAFHVIWGFTQVPATKRQFNWKKVLTFCKDYITQGDFINNKLGIKNDVDDAKPEWVIGAIGNLITKGTQHDTEAFNESLFPLTYEILSIIVPTLKPIIELNITKTDYLTYSLNSTAGKVLRALLDYALRVARLEHKSNEDIKWSSGIKTLFQLAIDKNILDVYILQGQYMWQFDYLDKEWNRRHIKKYYDIEDNYWFAYMGGYAFTQITNYREIYDLMIPHFKRAIKNKIELNEINKYGIIRHIAIYYLWGYEDIGGDNVITLFLNTANAKQINTLIGFFNQYESQINFHKEHEKIRNERIIALWQFVLNKFKNPNDEEDFKLISSLSKLIVFFKELTKENVELLTGSTKFINYDFNDTFLIEELDRLKDKGNQENSAKYVGKIFNEILTNSIPYYGEEEHIVSIIEFLYQFKSNNEIKNLTDDICNFYGRKGHDFLRNIFDKNH